MAKYRKQKKIDSGGFGCVYEALCLDDSKIVAFKELSGDKLAPEDKLRFAREVRIQSKLEHANIVPILGYNLAVEPPWFVMPLARSSLRRELAAKTFEGSLKRTVEVFFQILDGVAFAHDNGVIHRDLKPENVLFFEDTFGEDWARISDFGLGKRIDAESLTVTQSYVGLGTVPYMPPEQCHDLKRVDRRADIFSLGKVLYELLTHEFPLHVNTHSSRLPKRFGYVIGKCLEHDPDARYQTVKELKQDIQLIVSEQKKFEHPQKKISSLIKALDSGHGDEEKTLAAIDAIFDENADDEAFFTKHFAELGLHALEVYNTLNPTRFIQRLETFDGYLSDSLPFAYTDTVADLYERVWSITDNIDVRRLILRRLLSMGYYHNRWHVGSVFGKLIKAIDSDEDALIARDVLRSNPSAASWMKSYCEGGMLPVIKEGFPEEDE